MQTTSRKVQTAFRIDGNLLRRARLRASREGRSLNSMVEEVLERIAPETVWPKVNIPEEISPEILSIRLPEELVFDAEEVASDDRLAHALGLL